jgi:5-methyltetrahydrofolate--homocysteine methyltransferase
VFSIHQRYAAAGATVHLTNTFQSNPLRLAQVGLDHRLEAINRAALQLARQAAPTGFILGDIGPILAPGSGTEFADLDLLGRVLASLRGVDGFLFETCSSPRALDAVSYARGRSPLLKCRAGFAGGHVSEIEDTPLLLSLAYLRSPSGQLVTISGHGPEVYAEQAARHGVTALGVNCGRDIGMAEVIEVVRRYRAVTDLRLVARPNAGTPVRSSEGWVYPHGPEDMAEQLPELLEAGVRMVGGCCGTTPSHLAAFRAVVEGQR